MYSQLQRSLYRAAVEYGAKEPHTVTSIGELAVGMGMPIPEVLRQISQSCPRLFHAIKSKRKK
jgi:hypothetical protein